jgi:ribosomal protein L37AE/L43A
MDSQNCPECKDEELECWQPGLQNIWYCLTCQRVFRSKRDGWYRLINANPTPQTVQYQEFGKVML